jgi:hypothetical protein
VLDTSHAATHITMHHGKLRRPPGSAAHRTSRDSDIRSAFPRKRPLATQRNSDWQPGRVYSHAADGMAVLLVVEMPVVGVQVPASASISTRKFGCTRRSPAPDGGASEPHNRIVVDCISVYGRWRAASGLETRNGRDYLSCPPTTSSEP